MSTGDNQHELRFGPHTKEVEEVIDFVESGGVLARPFAPELAEEAGFETLTVTSLEGIRRYRLPWIEGAFIKKRSWFESIKRSDTDQYLFAEIFNDRNRTDELFEKFTQEGRRFRALLIRQIKTLLPSDEIDVIADDMERLLCARTAIGRSRIIPERFFDIYRAGGYPCGWRGSFPKGELVVFSR